MNGSGAVSGEAVLSEGGELIDGILAVTTGRAPPGGSVAQPRTHAPGCIRGADQPQRRPGKGEERGHARVRGQDRSRAQQSAPAAGAHAERPDRQAPGDRAGPSACYCPVVQATSPCFSVRFFLTPVFALGRGRLKCPARPGRHESRSAPAPTGCRCRACSSVARGRSPPSWGSSPVRWLFPCCGDPAPAAGARRVRAR